MNKCILVGRITKDPEVRTVNGGISVCQFTIAVNRKFQNPQGERKADFINCVAWRQSAELLGKYIHKGNQIGVEGSIQTRSYQNQQGQPVYVTEVAVESISFLEPKGNTQSVSPMDQGRDIFAQPSAPKASSNEDAFEDLKSSYDISNDDLAF